MFRDDSEPNFDINTYFDVNFDFEFDDNELLKVFEDQNTTFNVQNGAKKQEANRLPAVDDEVSKFIMENRNQNTAKKDAN